jgi:uncharacterized protein (TIGR00296 family)
MEEEEARKMTANKKLLTLKQGEYLVRLARMTIEDALKGVKSVRIEDALDDVFHEKKGVFVTLRKHPDKELRGCIGLPYPVKKLLLAVIDAATSAAFRDPRFPELTKKELDKVSIELTVLTDPEKIKGDPLKEIKLGKHGLIIKHGFRSGLLLPQVPGEAGWKTVEDYLEGLCWKAGLTPDMWMAPKTELYKFEGQIFSEESPRRGVSERR